jgi:IMP dehydrogenase/GMP reductase
VLDAGAACVVVDVAHGHMERCLDAVARIDREFDAEIVAGNVVTPAGVVDLAAAGADAVKVGVGPGSHCTTRQVTGAGMPQLTAVNDCADAARDLDVRIVADGGIRTSGDAVKALVAGADTVMLGSFFAGTDEAPGETVVVDGEPYKRSRGMSTAAANEARTDKEDNGPGADDGVPLGHPFGALVLRRAHTRDGTRERDVRPRLPERRRARGCPRGPRRAQPWPRTRRGDRTGREHPGRRERRHDPRAGRRRLRPSPSPTPRTDRPGTDSESRSRSRHKPSAPNVHVWTYA